MQTVEEITLPESKLTKRQRLKFGPKVYQKHGTTFRIIANVRHDDECGNGHNTFSITADIYEKLKNGQWRDYAGGCCHDKVVKHFPELAPLIKWHLTSTDGPMHYLSNVVYHAGNRDHWGCQKGEVRSWDLAVKFSNFPLEWKGRRDQPFIKWLKGLGSDLSNISVVAISHVNRPDESYKFEPKYSLTGFGKTWYDCPFNDRREAEQFLEALKLGFEIVSIPSAWGEGKKRDLDAARNCAVWPEATDEQLCAEPNELKAMLLARLPALMVEFKAAVESLGLVY